MCWDICPISCSVSCSVTDFHEGGQWGRTGAVFSLTAAGHMSEIAEIWNSDAPYRFCKRKVQVRVMRVVQIITLEVEDTRGKTASFQKRKIRKHNETNLNTSIYSWGSGHSSKYDSKTTTCLEIARFLVLKKRIVIIYWKLLLTDVIHQDIVQTSD